MIVQGHKLLTIDRDFLMSRLLYDHISGRFFWVAPPSNHLRLRGTVAGGNGTGYTMIKIDGQKYKAHRLAWLYVYGTMPDCVIDHRDGDPFNNAISNLRLATQAQNCANAKPWARKSLPKGVRENHGKFTARIRFNRELITIGTFDTPEEAARAYERQAVLLYGEFGRAA